MASTVSVITGDLNGKSVETVRTDTMQADKEQHTDVNKLKTLLGILRKFIGVTDLAAIRFSLPASLLEPTPNLEYWNYVDRPEAFISITDSTDPVGRMLGTLRFWFTKDIKHVKGKPVKPYNSTLGEFFRCNWEVDDSSPALKYPASTAGSSAASFNSQTSRTTAEHNSRVKVSFLTEQTSHHPPVSAFYIDCPEKGMYARGYDHVAAKFTGTSVRISPGAHNHGIYITLKNWGDEEYRLTHPSAHVGGILRGNLSVSVTDYCYITCPKTGLKIILQYVEEGWFGKAQHKVEGVIFRYNPAKDDKLKIKDVPESDIVGRIDGSWQDKVYYTLGSAPFKQAREKNLLIDLEPLHSVAKIVPPLEQQLPNESRRFWDEVTAAIVGKQYGQATTLKHEIEERQRHCAASRKERGVEWQPRFFATATDSAGRPELTADGGAALQRMQADEFVLEPNKELGA